MAPLSALLIFFTHHRVAANLLMVLMILSGVWGLSKLNTQFFPTFELDAATVRVVWSGASAEDVESSIVTPVERELRNLNGLKNITSTAATGLAAITLEFDAGTDMGMALDEVNERMAQIRNLPTTAEKPEVTRVVRYEQIARLLVASDAKLDELRPLVYQFKEELLQRGIARIDIHGLPKEEIAIQIPALRLQELGLSLEQIAAKIGQQSRDLPAGLVGKDDVARQLRSLGQQRSAEGFMALPLQSDAQGGLLTVGDVAEIARRPREDQRYYFSAGRAVVELTLQRTATA
ncbi:MAG: acriflavin resistance protein, partial [Halothiobacillaceae bacterium]